MDTSATDEQRMLAESARKVMQPRDGAAPAAWADFAELGWLALPLPEAHGGLGGGLPELCVLAEELGRGLSDEPYGACAVLAAGLLADAAPPALAAQWLPALAEGRRRVVFAPFEPGARHDAGVVATSAEQQAGAWRLDGAKALALGGAGVDAVLLLARCGPDCLGLFLAEADAPGLRQHVHALYDGRQALSLQLRGAAAQLVQQGTRAEMQARVATALRAAAVVHAAETVGTMGRAFEITRAYVGMRRQFGQPISANQVIQHRLVDLYVEIEELRALVRAAALAPQPRLVHAAAALAGQVARHVWEGSIQLHGAIGMTEECAVGRCVRRLALGASAYGDPHHHLAALADELLGALE